MFNLNAYRRILGAIQESGRRVIDFGEGDPPKNSLILRHDVDYDLKWALQLAEENARQSISAVFFVLPGSSFYNLFSEKNRSLLRRISELDQKIALHFEGSSLVDELEVQFALLKLAAPQSQKWFSFHNPSEKQLREPNVPLGWVGAYDSRFFQKGCYFSDSNGRNSPEKLASVIRESKESFLQILLHPFNWVLGGKGIEEIIQRTAEEKLKEQLVSLEQNDVWKKQFEGRFTIHMRPDSKNG